MKENSIAGLEIGTHLIPIAQAQAQARARAQAAPPAPELPGVHTKLDWPPDRPGLSYRWLIYALAIVLVLLLVLVIHAHRGSAPNDDEDHSNMGRSCVPSKDIPRIVSHRLIDDNSTILAQAAGFVQLLDGQLGLGYLALDFHSVYREPVYRGPTLISLVGDCTILEIAYEHEPNRSDYKYVKLELLIRKPDGIRPQKRCELVKGTYGYVQPSKARYSCQETRTWMCDHVAETRKGIHMNQQVAQLVLSSLQLEIDADPLAAQRGEFSKAVWAGSCTTWLD